jgi:DNA-binding TFAR19-related protein (PDSD5 family)
MSEDTNFEILKRRKLLEMQKRLLLKKTFELMKEKVKKPEDPKKILLKAFAGRGLEVWNAAEQQYPIITRKLMFELVSIINAGKLKNKITGEQLYSLFRSIGLRIRLNTKIRIFEKGKFKTIADKLREK